MSTGRSSGAIFCVNEAKSRDARSELFAGKAGAVMVLTMPARVRCVENILSPWCVSVMALIVISQGVDDRSGEEEDEELVYDFGHGCTSCSKSSTTRFGDSNSDWFRDCSTSDMTCSGVFDKACRIGVW